MSLNNSLSCLFPRGFGHIFLMALVIAVVDTGFAKDEINLYNEHETKRHGEYSAAYFGYQHGQSLVGTWHLTAEIVAGNTNPFSGRILNIDRQGLFNEDFSTTTSPRAPECSTVGRNFGASSGNCCYLIEYA